ncbi:MAG: DUF5681 domain-containing protein [Acidobacteriaceae bacterium]
MKSKEGSQTGEYEVGFKKPPKHTRFRGGVSGNPQGRPKGAKSVSGVLAKLCREQITVTINGKTRSLSSLDALLLRLRANALSGDAKASREFFNLLRLFPKPMETVTVSSATSERDEAALKSFIERLRNSETEEGQ